MADTMNLQEHKKLGMKPKKLRYDNYLAVADLFRQYGQLTVRDIGDKISLSRTSISKILDSMIKNEDIKLVGKGDSTEAGGKRPDIYVLNDEKGYCICLAFWDKGCEGRIIDLKYNVVVQSVYKSEEMLNDDEIIVHMVDMVHELLEKSKIDSEKIIVISLQSGGIINENGILVQPVKYSNYTRNFQVCQQMQEKLDVEAPIYYDNVSRFSAYYELLNRSDRGIKEIMVISSDGKHAGGAVIESGEFYRGFENMAGEFGHIPVSTSEKMQCDCGNFGCFEVMTSEKYIKKRLKELLVIYPESILLDAAEDFSYYMLFDAVNQKDPLAVDLIDELIGYFQIMLGNAKFFLNPAEIILQGIFAYQCDYFRESLQEIMHNSSFDSNCEITYSDIDYKTSAFTGAALFSFDKYYRQPNRI